MRSVRQLIAVLCLGVALLAPARAGPAPAAQGDEDHLALADLSTRPVGIDAPDNVIPFQVELELPSGIHIQRVLACLRVRRRCEDVHQPERRQCRTCIRIPAR